MTAAQDKRRREREAAQDKRRKEREARQATAEKRRRDREKVKDAAAEKKRKADEKKQKKKDAAADKKRKADEKKQKVKDAAAEKKRKANEKITAKELERAAKLSGRSNLFPSLDYQQRFWMAVQRLHPSYRWSEADKLEVWEATVRLWRAYRRSPEEAAQAVCHRCEVATDPPRGAPIAGGARETVGRLYPEDRLPRAASFRAVSPLAAGGLAPLPSTPQGFVDPLALRAPPSAPPLLSGVLPRALGQGAAAPMELRPPPPPPPLCPADKPECSISIDGGTCTISARLAVPGAGSQRAERIGARYCLVEIDQLRTSNQPLKGYQPTPGYPPEAQERDYRLPAEAQKVQGIADDYQPELVFNTNPGALDGVPVANQDRIVLGGNGRTMATALVYAGRGGVDADTPRLYLMEHAHEFGLTAEVVAQFQRPMLVRTVATSSDPRELAQWSRRLNTALSQQLDGTRLAVSRARFVPESALRQLAALSDDETLAAFLSSARSVPFVRELQQSGVIDTRATDLYVGPGGILTEQGRDLVEDLLVAVLVPDAGMITAFGRGPTAALARAAPYFVAVSGAPDFDLRSQVAAAVRDRVAMRAAAAPSVAYFLRQGGLFTTEAPKVAGDERAILLLEVLTALDGSPAKLARFARRYAELAAANPTAQGGLFAQEKVSPLEALRRAAKEAGVELAAPAAPPPVAAALFGREQSPPPPPPPPPPAQRFRAEDRVVLLSAVDIGGVMWPAGYLGIFQYERDNRLYVRFDGPSWFATPRPDQGVAAVPPGNLSLARVPLDLVSLSATLALPETFGVKTFLNGRFRAKELLTRVSEVASTFSDAPLAALAGALLEDLRPVLFGVGAALGPREVLVALVAARDAGVVTAAGFYARLPAERVAAAEAERAAEDRRGEAAEAADNRAYQRGMQEEARTERAAPKGRAPKAAAAGGKRAASPPPPPPAPPAPPPPPPPMAAQVETEEEREARASMMIERAIMAAASKLQSARA